MTDPRIDAYIAKAAPFAQPILMRLLKPPARVHGKYERQVRRFAGA